MTPPEVDRMELWQAAVMLGRDEKPSEEEWAEQLARNVERAKAERARAKDPEQLASRRSRVIRSA